MMEYAITGLDLLRLVYLKQCETWLASMLTDPNLFTDYI